MATIPELLDGQITLEMECLDRLYLNGYIGKLATGGGLVGFMRGHLEKPVPSPVVLGQVSERFRDAVKAQAEGDQIPIYQFQHKERKDDIANNFQRNHACRTDTGVNVGHRMVVRWQFLHHQHGARWRSELCADHGVGECGVERGGECDQPGERFRRRFEHGLGQRSDQHWRASHRHHDGHELPLHGRPE